MACTRRRSEEAIWKTPRAINERYVLLAALNTKINLPSSKAEAARRCAPDMLGVRHAGRLVDIRRSGFTFDNYGRQLMIMVGNDRTSGRHVPAGPVPPRTVAG
ncbi:hypothetical protein [Xanthomonas fragariae]|uniref:hypothetical protein n=1 Tax=Xanthomonas fragariae TaxID=48664 RepID=UPI001ABE51E0|nr:hypothetical protein [Xanthomonas fragariae]UKR53515.1 hypothetical protein K4A87_06200 [Xanthomonas fragariae]